MFCYISQLVREGFLSPNSSRTEIICIQCGVEVNADKRRKLFQTCFQCRKIKASVKVEKVVSYSLFPESYLTNIMCPSCSDKN